MDWTTEMGLLLVVSMDSIAKKGQATTMDKTFQTLLFQQVVAMDMTFQILPSFPAAMGTAKEHFSHLGLLASSSCRFGGDETEEGYSKAAATDTSFQNCFDWDEQLSFPKDISQHRLLEMHSRLAHLYSLLATAVSAASFY